MGQLVVELDQLRDGGVEAHAFDVFGDLLDRAVHLAIEGFGDRRVADVELGGWESSSSPTRFRQTAFRNRLMPTMSRVFQGFCVSRGPMYIS